VRVGGGGSERYMVIIPSVLGFFVIVYALGGPNQTLMILENMAQSGLEWVRGLVR
jgi:hypothetical protein